MPPADRPGRIALRIEYDGSRFHGFQLQPPSHGVTVQGVLEQHLTSIVAAPVRITCAGRTDTGVHATAQVVHFDCPVARPLRAWTQGLDRKLGAALGVRAALPVTAEFHARFSAQSRRYCYLIDDSGNAPVIAHQQLTGEPERLDVAAMAAAAGQLCGEHDFSSFRAAGCQATSPVRRLSAIDVRRAGNLVVVDVTANAFLQHMVRNLVGALLLVGRGLREPAWLAALLALRDRTRAPPTAPPTGLYLIDVVYPERFGLPCGPWWPPLLAATLVQDSANAAHSRVRPAADGGPASWRD